MFSEVHYIMKAMGFISSYYDVASGSDTTPCNKINKPLVVYRFWKCYEITPIIKPHIYDKMLTFSHQKCDSKVMLMSYDK